MPNITLLEQEDSPSHPDAGDSSPAEKNTPTLALKPLASAAVGFKMQRGSMQDSGSSPQLSDSRGREGGLRCRTACPSRPAATWAPPQHSQAGQREEGGEAAGCQAAAGLGSSCGAGMGHTSMTKAAGAGARRGARQEKHLTGGCEIKQPGGIISRPPATAFPAALLLFRPSQRWPRLPCSPALAPSKGDGTAGLQSRACRASDCGTTRPGWDDRPGVPSPTRSSVECRRCMERTRRARPQHCCPMPPEHPWAGGNVPTAVRRGPAPSSACTWPGMAARRGSAAASPAPISPGFTGLPSSRSRPV